MADLIDHSDIGGDEDRARVVLLIAKDIAPCISSFSRDSEDGKNAIAILRGVFADSKKRGSRMVKSQRVGPASVEYSDVRSAFDGDPTRALRALCSADAGAGRSRGSFPTERPVSRLWPERY